MKEGFVCREARFGDKSFVLCSAMNVARGVPTPVDLLSLWTGDGKVSNLLHGTGDGKVSKLKSKPSKTLPSVKPPAALK